MKKIITIFCMSLSTLTFTQVKFYTNNGTKEVSELNGEMKDIKVKVPLPKEIYNYELIEIAYEDFHAFGDHVPKYIMAKEFKTDNLKGKQNIELWIKKPNSNDGEFCGNIAFIGNTCNELGASCSSVYRNYTYGTVKIKVFGKEIIKWIWQDGQKVPEYKYTELSSGKINMNYGKIATEISSKDKLYTVQKYTGGQYYGQIISQNHDDNMTVTYSSEKEWNDKYTARNIVVFNIQAIRDGSNNTGEADMMGGSPSTSSSIDIDYVKNSIAINLFKQANPNAEKSIKDAGSGYFWNNFGSIKEEHLYSPMLMVSNTSSNGDTKKNGTVLKKVGGTFGSYTSSGKPNGDYQKKLDEEEAKLVWKKTKIGNLTGETLEIQIYTDKQVEKDSEGNYKIKNDEIGKTKTIIFFTGEKDGIITAGSMYKVGTMDLTDDEHIFWNHMLTSIKIND